jgi:hypothetical protein
MHRGHDHDHHHHHDGHTHGAVHTHHPAAGPLGHNGPAGKAVQWQTAHQPHEPAPAPADPRTVDLDLVETAFLEAFSRASDPVSFLRLAGIPFVGETADGQRLHLLRVETDDVTDVGAVMPLLGGSGVRYDPLPAKMTSRRRRLGFIYHDGIRPTRIGFAEARRLTDRSDASVISLQTP